MNKTPLEHTRHETQEIDRRTNTQRENMARKAGKAQQTEKLAPLRHQRQPKFQVGKIKEPDEQNLLHYEWHLIMNHTRSDAFTRVTRNPNLKIPSLDHIKATTKMSCKGCLEGKIPIAPHH